MLGVPASRSALRNVNANSRLGVNNTYREEIEQLILVVLYLLLLACFLPNHLLVLVDRAPLDELNWQVQVPIQPLFAESCILHVYTIT